MSPKISPSTDVEWREYYENKCRELRKEIAAMRPGFNELVNDVSHNLPEGWEVVLHVENGSATAELFNDEGDKVHISVQFERIEDEFAHAAKFARGETP